MRAAHNLRGNFAIAEVDSGDVHVIGIGVCFTREDVSHHQAFQTATDGLHLFDAAHFQTDGGKGNCNFFGRKVKIDILFQPLIGYVHNLNLFANVGLRYVQNTLVKKDKAQRCINRRKISKFF